MPRLTSNGFRPLAVVFDLDGLMFDTEALFAKVIADMLEARGKPSNPGIMRAMIGRRAVDAGDAFRQLSGLQEPKDALMAEARIRFHDEVETAVHPTPGLFALLQHLAAIGLPRAVATSSRRSYAEALIGRHGLLEHFSFLLTSEDVLQGKPDPEIYRKAADRFGVSSGSMLVLEDSAAGISAAKGAGAFAVGVPHAHSPAEVLGAADLIVDRLDAPILLHLFDPAPDPDPTEMET
jgi:HAD superfamily hydrolase (TIGR01509 family)